MRKNEAALGATLVDGRPNSAWDSSVHVADLYEALGRGIPPTDTWLPVFEAWQSKVPSALADAAAYEQFRALFSRRSRSQLETMAGGPDPALADVGVFGPRDDDQPIPG